MSNKPTYEDLEVRLAQAEAILESLRSGEVDAILGDRGLLVLRLRGAEEELRASEELKARIIESSRDCITVLDLDGRLLSMSRGGQELLEIADIQPYLGRNWVDFWKGVDRENALAAVDAARNGNTGKFEGYRETEKGSPAWWEVIVTPICDSENRVESVLAVSRNCTERKVTEKQQQLAMQVLATLNRDNDISRLVGDILRLIKERTGFEAVGIRLHDGDDYPYYVTSGFSPEFVQAERYLCERNQAGEPVEDCNGNSVLECMCGNIICGRFDPAKPFFTERGSFWSNCTTDLLASTTEKDRQSRTRNRCNGEGYESVALIPLRSGEEVIGLLQLNDHRKNMFTLDMIRFFEDMGASTGIAVARKRAADEVWSTAKFASENPNSVLRIAQDGTLLYANPAAVTQLADWQPQTGQPAPAVLRDIACRSLDQGSGQRIDVEYGERTYSFSIAPIAEAGYANLYSLDITQQKRDEEALRRFQHAVESSSDAVGMSTPQGNHFYQNRAFDEIFGEIGEDPPSTVYVDEAVGHEVFETIMSGREWTGEVRMSGRHGNLLDILLRAYPMKDQQGAITGLVGVHTDITEQRSMEAQLRQAQKMESVGRLAGGVAHDFNNLLMGVMGYVELCRDELPPEHPVRCYLDEITADSQRSANLTRQLLAFARKQIIAPKVLDLNDTVSSMLKLLRRLIGEDIDLAWMPGLELWTVKMDPSQIDQILANLCVNARDAIGGVGKLTIETRNVTFDATYCAAHAEFVPGAYVLLAVSDDGCGMDAETREQIFEPFFTTKGVGEGTGLGLATVYGIVKQNNGFINVYSEPGKGTTLKIYLSRFGDEAAGEADAATPTARPGGNETILLVEDEKSIRVTAALFLEALGYTVLAADCPEEALRLAAEHPGRIHLLITDVVMPGMSGRDLATQLATDRPQMKRLFMSGYTADVIAHRGVLDEGVEFLGKPFTRDDLARKVREVLDV